MADRAFYLEQAALCGRAAAAATLANQRDKFLVAQKAWETLAAGGDARIRSVLAGFSAGR
jgi:hypothetical protein